MRRVCRDGVRSGAGNASFYGNGLFLQANNGIVNLFVAALTKARTQELLRSIIPSLQDVGRGGSAGPGTTVGD